MRVPNHTERTANSEPTGPMTMTNATGEENDIPTEVQRQGFEAVRNAHQSEMVEDYVELIADLIDENGGARPVDIAKRLGVSAPTVSKNLARLVREDFITNERYRGVQLTQAGQQLAHSCKIRHRIIVDFLIALGVPRQTAELDAEGLEHHVSDETLTAFRDFVTPKE